MPRSVATRLDQVGAPWHRGAVPTAASTKGLCDGRHDRSSCPFIVRRNIAPRPFASNPSQMKRGRDREAKPSFERPLSSFLPNALTERQPLFHAYRDREQPRAVGRPHERALFRMQRGALGPPGPALRKLDDGHSEKAGTYVSAGKCRWQGARPEGFEPPTLALEVCLGCFGELSCFRSLIS
jgi:hypothetical protein